MNNIPNLIFPKIKSVFKIIMPFIAVIIVLTAAGYLAWLNHNDFENAIIRQTQTQLLITALSEAKIVEKHINDTGGYAEGVNELVKHINDLEKVYTFIITDNGKILSYPYANYIGKNILVLTKEKISERDWISLLAVMRKIKNGESGTNILNFFSEDEEPKIVKTLVAFSPIRIGKNKGSIVIVMEYNVIANLIHRNLRDNFLFMAFTNFVLVIFGVVLFRIHKERDKLAISEAALNIINKQLHSEIDDRKKSAKIKNV